jgi:Fe-S-cluster-containing dehydrogenase component/CRP-like cAMP-binding protein
MSETIVMMARQFDDRWSSFTARPGLAELSSLRRPDQLRQIDLLREFDDDFLRDISPDLAIATWEPQATLFKAGTYLDVAFYVLDGTVDLELQVGDAHRPIFGTRSVSLATEDFNLAPGESLRIGAGDVFGEIGAMNGWPQAVTARTATRCTLLQIRLPALRKLKRKSKTLKQRMDQVYRERTLRQHLRSTPVLQGLGPELIDALAAHVELVSCQPGDVVAREGSPVEHLILVRSGSLRMSQAIGTGEIAVSYVSKGSTVGESELLVDEMATWEVTATSVGYSELVRIPREDFLRVLKRAPELEKRLWAIAGERIKEIASRRAHLDRADLLDFSLAKGLTQANSVLVIDLETCTRCDDCVRGCASTHGGTPRFVREGEVHEGFLIARSCYHCQDPTCLVGCPTGAITRTNIGDTVAIDPAVCIGCGSCAENCQYDSIVIHDLGVTWGPDAMPRHLRGQPRSVASKCDLCREAPEGPACVSSCPHGAAIRVAGAEEFDVLIQTKRRRQLPLVPA